MASAGLTGCATAPAPAAVSTGDGPAGATSRALSYVYARSDGFRFSVRMRGDPAIVGPAEREPHLRLIEEGTRVAGSTGCNTLLGQYARTAEGLRFSRMVTTRMVCLDPAVARQEQGFVARTRGV